MSGGIKMVKNFSGRIRGTRNSRGQSTVEFALLIPALLLVILVLLDVGRAYFTNQVTLNASRQGARAGVLPEGSSADVISAVTSVFNDAQLSGQAVTYSNVGSGFPAGATTTVTVTYPFQTLTGAFIPGWEGTIVLEQTVQMRHE